MDNTARMTESLTQMSINNNNNKDEGIEMTDAMSPVTVDQERMPVEEAKSILDDVTVDKDVILHSFLSGPAASGISNMLNFIRAEEMWPGFSENDSFASSGNRMRGPLMTDTVQSVGFTIISMNSEGGEIQTAPARMDTWREILSRGTLQSTHVIITPGNSEHSEIQTNQSHEQMHE